MEQVTACPNCNADIKFGVFDSNLIIPKEKTEAINFVLKTEAPAHCDMCGVKAMAEARSQFFSLFNGFKNYVNENSGIVPITTIPMPFGWEYTVLGMVTSQTVTADGTLDEFKLSWNDLVGIEYPRLNSKLSNSEELCKSKIRIAAIIAGGNAVVGTDVDYGQLRSVNGVLMICMSGTAVRLNNPDVISPGWQEKVGELVRNYHQLKKFEVYESVFRN